MQPKVRPLPGSPLGLGGLWQRNLYTSVTSAQVFLTGWNESDWT